MPHCHDIDYYFEVTKGQIISKGLFGVLEFSQKTNERIRRSSRKEFVRYPKSSQGPGLGGLATMPAVAALLHTYFNQRDLQPRPRSVAKEKEMKKQKETEKKDEQSLLHE